MAKQSDDSKVVIFDEKGNIVKSTTKSTRVKTFKKDPHATEMFETHSITNKRVKFVWYTATTNPQRILLFFSLFVCFFIIAYAVRFQVEKNNKKYEETVRTRVARGCKYPTMVVYGLKEGYPMDPDEGCSPE